MDDFELHQGLIGVADGRNQLNTPVLVLDLDALDRNLTRMAKFAHAHGVGLRPHAKTHKSVEIARRQVSLGALGVCCAKIGEAEVLADGGLDGLLITSPVVSASAVARLAALNSRLSGLIVAIDNADNARSLAAAVGARGQALNVVIDVDPGIRRTGVASADAAVELARVVAGLPALKLCGVQCYCGAQQHIEGYEERRAATQERLQYLRSVVEALRGAGFSVDIVTGGGTGTHRIDVEERLFTELQVGSYAFMDGQYNACVLAETDPSPFETSLMVDARVVSVNAGPLVTVDAGFKAFSTDAQPPKILDGAPEAAGYAFMGDEHGALILRPGANARPSLGDRVSFSTPHCDPTVNLYDNYHVVSGDRLVGIWPVSARGRSR